MAAQDIFLCALVHESQCREIAWIIKLSKAHLDVDFFDRGITVSLAFNSFSSSGPIFVSPGLGAAPWAPFCCGPGTDRGVASSTRCSHGPKLSPCRERGWLPPQLL